MLDLAGDRCATGWQLAQLLSDLPQDLGAGPDLLVLSPIVAVSRGFQILLVRLNAVRLAGDPQPGELVVQVRLDGVDLPGVDLGKLRDAGV